MAFARVLLWYLTRRDSIVGSCAAPTPSSFTVFVCHERQSMINPGMCRLPWSLSPCIQCGIHDMAMRDLLVSSDIVRPLGSDDVCFSMCSLLSPADERLNRGSMSIMKPLSKINSAILPYPHYHTDATLVHSTSCLCKLD